MFLLHLLIFIPSFLYKTEHYYDLTGSLSFLGSIGLVLFLHPQPTLRVIITCLCIVLWSARLGAFLFFRVKRVGKDGRFDQIKTQFSWFLMTWTFSVAWVLISLGPSLIAVTTKKQLGFDSFAYLGFALWFVGFFIEVIADWQKTQFKKRNPNAFINSGLWRYSRHPNYVGEVLLWLGLSIAAFPYLESFQYLLLASPVLIYVLLRYISGVNMLETRADKKWGGGLEYESYKANTAIFFPLKLK